MSCSVGQCGFPSPTKKKWNTCLRAPNQALTVKIWAASDKAA